MMRDYLHWMLTFSAAPNFEAPQDVDANNLYSVVINASDGQTTSTRTLSIEVINALEGRVVDAPLANAIVCVATLAADDCSEALEQTVTDSDGYYLLPVTDANTLIDANLRSIGGTDIVTQQVLDIAAFSAAIPTDPIDQSTSIAITPLSTLLAKADDPAVVLSVLGVPEGVSTQTLLALDPWLISTESAGDANEFAALAELASSTGLEAATLSTLALDILIASSQMTNLILIANELVSDTTSSGIQTTAERAVMVSDSVMDALLAQITAASATAQGRQKLGGLGGFSFSDATVINSVLTETVRETATTIVETIEEKQVDGRLDLTTATEEVVAAVNAVKEAAEVVQQTGADAALTAKIVNVATATAQSNAVVENLITTGGAEAITNSESAAAIAEIVTNTVSQTAAFVDDEIDETTFEAETNAEEQANSNTSLSDKLDSDNDGIPNTEDTDDDGDGVADVDDAFELDPTESVDTDSDGIGNNADTDDDGDGVIDADDAFDLDKNETIDTDGDGIGNNADTDDDGDGVSDADDAFDLDKNETIDTDGDGIGNNADTDDDGDGVSDADDAFDLDKNETIDTDGDGIGNNADTDDDGDGLSDSVESEGGSNPLVADTDGDGVIDGQDAFPTEVGEVLDTDGDGIGNNADTDDDGDQITDGADLDPLDATVPPPCVWGASNWGECKWQ